jgi:hypothetical protein
MEIHSDYRHSESVEGEAAAHSAERRLDADFVLGSITSRNCIYVRTTSQIRSVRTEEKGDSLLGAYFGNPPPEGQNDSQVS